MSFCVMYPEKMERSKAKKGRRGTALVSIEKFLKTELAKATTPGLSWVDQSQGIFQVSWKQKATKSWVEDIDAAIFIKYELAHNRKPDDARKMKERFRNAINRSKKIYVLAHDVHAAKSGRPSYVRCQFANMAQKADDENPPPTTLAQAQAYLPLTQIQSLCAANRPKLEELLGLYERNDGTAKVEDVGTQVDIHTDHTIPSRTPVAAVYTQENRNPVTNTMNRNPVTTTMNRTNTVTKRPYKLTPIRQIKANPLGDHTHLYQIPPTAPVKVECEQQNLVTVTADGNLSDLSVEEQLELQRLNELVDQLLGEDAVLDDIEMDSSSDEFVKALVETYLPNANGSVTGNAAMLSSPISPSPTQSSVPQTPTQIYNLPSPSSSGDYTIDIADYPDGSDPLMTTANLYVNDAHSLIKEEHGNQSLYEEWFSDLTTPEFDLSPLSPDSPPLFSEILY